MEISQDSEKKQLYYILFSVDDKDKVIEVLKETKFWEEHKRPFYISPRLLAMSVRIGDEELMFLSLSVKVYGTYKTS